MLNLLNQATALHQAALVRPPLSCNPVQGMPLSEAAPSLLAFERLSRG